MSLTDDAAYWRTTNRELIRGLRRRRLPATAFVIGDKLEEPDRAQKYALVREQTWMVGNSPVSDINPALSAGLNAVFIPNDMTWVLENDEVRSQGSSGRLLVVERFAQLRQYF